MLVSDIITTAMSKIGAINAGETPTAVEYALMLDNINIMLGQWSGRGLMVRSNVSEGLALTAGTGVYTIGPGSPGTAKFVTSKPISALFAMIRDTNGFDSPVEIITQQQYWGIPSKSSQSRPSMLWYDPGDTQQTYPSVGTLSLYPVPDSAIAYTLWLSSDKYLTEFSAVTDTITLEPAYYAAMMFGLAVGSYRDFHKHSTAIPEDLISLARDTRHTIQNMNSVRWISTIEIPGGRRGSYDINVGSAG